MIPRVFIRRVRTRSTADFAQSDPSFASRKVNPPKPGPSRFPDKPRPYSPRRFERRRFSAYRFETRPIELSPTSLVVGVILACRPASTTHSRARAASLPDSEAFTHRSSRPLSATPPIATRLHGPTARPLSSRRSSRKRHDRLLVVLDRDGFPNRNRLACRDRASWNGSRLSVAPTPAADRARQWSPLVESVVRSLSWSPRERRRDSLTAPDLAARLKGSESVQQSTTSGASAAPGCRPSIEAPLAGTRRATWSGASKHVSVPTLFSPVCLGVIMGGLARVRGKAQRRDVARQ